MALLWTICGTGRGVGKTHLALALCAALPHAVYAKLGGGHRQDSKPENYFTNESALATFVEQCQDTYAHIVVEANAWAAVGKGDIIIFLDSTSHANKRDDADALRHKAHIHIHPRSLPQEWEEVLAIRLPANIPHGKIRELLVAQQQFVAGTALHIRSKVWFVALGEHVFGYGLANLLDETDRLGTLVEAARSIEMSYRYAWGLIKDAEKRLGEPLILPHAGGTGGGQTVLSPAGQHLLTVFKRVNAEVTAYANARFDALYHGEAHNDQH